MNIAAICRCDKTGLGIQSKEFFDNIPCKALVIDIGGLEQHYEWFPNQRIVKVNSIGTGTMPEEMIRQFLIGIDVLIAFETPYDYNIFRIARQMGVKTVLQLNYEFLDYPSELPKPDLFAAPSMWHYDDIPEPKMFLPVPVNTKHFKTVLKTNTFVHIVGKKAAHDRNGTMCFLNSLKHVKNNIEVVIRSQYPLVIPNDVVIPENVKITYDFTDKPNYYDNYTGGVLVLPRKYGGLCLPCQEALAAGMPVIMPNIAPNDSWLPDRWLVPAKWVSTFRCKKKVAVFETDQIELAKMIDKFCYELFYYVSVVQAQATSEMLSWEKVKPMYYEMFKQLIQCSH